MINQILKMIILMIILSVYSVLFLVELSAREQSTDRSNSSTVRSSIPVTPESIRQSHTYTKNDESVLCLAKNMFFEARNQGNRGMRLVAYVTLNRTISHNYSNTVCGVVYEPYQFSWTHLLENSHFQLTNQIDWQSWQEAKALAVEIMNSGVPDKWLNIYDYHADYICPNICKSELSRFQYKQHIFYIRN